MLDKISIFLRMIKIEHSLFAMPFALTGLILAAGGIPPVAKIFWIIVAMVAARTFAMGVNRVVDAEIDLNNPRTSAREIPAGKISKAEALIYILISFFIYEYATYALNILCFILSPIPVIIFIIYAYSKRFTFLSHLILGVSLGLAPVGAWVAITGVFDTGIILLGIGVLFWVAGFDILYAIEDIKFDKAYGLYSLPSYLGIKNALYLSRIFHLVAFITFTYIKFYYDLGYIYLTGIILIGLIMFYEHSLVKIDNLSKLNVAFFNMNAYISLTVFIFTSIDILL